ncbi:MAG: DUF2924 domain-containing protein [Alphaproteobacteria bacterium]
MRRASKIASEVAELETLDRVALAAQWEALMKRSPPKACSRVFLLRALSYELQSKHAPDLSKTDMRALKASLGKVPSSAVENDREEDAATTTPNAKTKPRRKAPARLALVPGARLVREWNGQAYTVSVIKEGFVYKDRTWSSLSAIAKDITGAHWSGPRFFGLDKAA